MARISAVSATTSNDVFAWFSTRILGSDVSARTMLSCCAIETGRSSVSTSPRRVSNPLGNRLIEASRPKTRVILRANSRRSGRKTVRFSMIVPRNMTGVAPTAMMLRRTDENSGAIVEMSSTITRPDMGLISPSKRLRRVAGPDPSSSLTPMISPAVMEKSMGCRKEPA